jgi:hypothetical protein
MRPGFSPIEAFSIQCIDASPDTRLPMRKSDLRASARVSTTRKGALKFGNVSFPCLVLDISDGGFQIMPTVTLEVGQVLDFQCELYPGKPIECKIEVRHVGDSSVGTMIKEIDAKGAGLCQMYLQEHYAGRLDRSA